MLKARMVKITWPTRYAPGSWSEGPSLPGALGAPRCVRNKGDVRAGMAAQNPVLVRLHPQGFLAGREEGASRARACLPSSLAPGEPAAVKTQAQGSPAAYFLLGVTHRALERMSPCWSLLGSLSDKPRRAAASVVPEAVGGAHLVVGGDNRAQETCFLIVSPAGRIPYPFSLLQFLNKTIVQL